MNLSLSFTRPERWNLPFDLLVWPFYLMLMIGLVVPSDAHHGFLSPKSLSFVTAILGTGSLALLKMRIRTSFLKTLCFLCYGLAFLVLWLLLGTFQDSSILHPRLDQFKLFLITLAVPVLTLYLLSEKKVSSQRIFKTVIFANIFYCSIKVGLVFLHLIKAINIWKLLGGTGIVVQSMFIFGEVQRLQTSVDISTPFLLFFLLQSSRLGIPFSNRFKAVYIAITLISNLLTFSRFLLFIYFICLMLHLFTLPISKMARAALMLMAATLGILFAIGIDHVAMAIHQRFLSEENALSDRARYKQVEALLGEFEKSPYLGQGLGGYVKDHIRDKNILHSYEVQWIAFLMQFGLIGVLLLLIPLIFIGLNLIRPPLSRAKLAFASLFALWLLSGFTNPFLISLQSGIVYTLFLLAGIRLSQTQNPSL